MSGTDLIMEHIPEPGTVKLEEVKMEECFEGFEEEVQPLCVNIDDIHKEIQAYEEKPGCSKWAEDDFSGVKVKEETSDKESKDTIRIINSVKSEPPDPLLNSSCLDNQSALNHLKTEPENDNVKDEVDVIHHDFEIDVKQDDTEMDGSSSGAKRSASGKLTTTSLDNPDFKRQVGYHINYKCDICSYETRFKPHYRSHLLTHKKPEEIEWIQCPLCSHKTKTRANLNTHLGTHKATDKIYHCTQCGFKTKYRKTYNMHFKEHGIVKIDRFECPYCDYETPNKYTLEMHVVIHKDESETDIFYCQYCPYRAKRKRDLRVHSIRHKSMEEMKTFKCPDCDYQSKRKADLKSHSIKHKKPDEVEILKCPFCEYKSKYKQAFKTHMEKHKNPDEVEMFYCDVCTYKTRFKHYLKKHRLFKHKIQEPQFNRLGKLCSADLSKQFQRKFEEIRSVENPQPNIVPEPQFVKVESTQYDFETS